jgi:ubiquinone biosynthesis protein UbiJ
MLISAVITPTNHLLRNDKWTQERLRAYSGKTICIRELPLIDLKLYINAEGEVRSVNSSNGADATLTLSPLLLPRLLTRESAAFDRIKIVGDEIMAKALIDIGKQIDLATILAHDLSKVIGDIPAHRLGKAGEQLLRWHADNIDRISQTIAEYLIEEKDYLAKGSTIRQFAEDVCNLHHDTEQLELRLVRLTQHHGVFSPSHNR